MTLFDKQLELRDIASGAETSTSTEAGITFPVLKAGEFKAVFYVSALDATNADETYEISIIVADTTGNLSGSGVTAASVPIVSTGVYEIGLSSELIKAVDADAGAITCKATLGGTTPSLTYGCYLAPVW